MYVFQQFQQDQNGFGWKTVLTWPGLRLLSVMLT
jgi:hypothetical protein